MGDARAQVREAFPAVDDIQDDGLREGVLQAWVTAMAENGIEDLAALPWLPPEQARLDLPDERLVPHVNGVVDGALAEAEVLLAHRDDVDLSLDLLLAGALVHDVSKCYEFDGEEETDVGRLLGHPHFGVHVAAAAGLPVEVQHVVLAHSHRTAVEPTTLEAEIVAAVDRVAARAIRMQSDAYEG